MKTLSDNLQGSNASTEFRTVLRREEALQRYFTDALAVEEPLEIHLAFFIEGQRERKIISVTMRTPGHDEELAIGFLFTEGIIKKGTVVEKLEPFVCEQGKENRITLLLSISTIPDLTLADRNFYTTSSCGVCGKSSIQAIRTLSEFLPQEQNDLLISRETILLLPGILKNHQLMFESTGGLHGCGLFSLSGALISLREDVGRHNALDKLIGHAFMDRRLPLENTVLLLSGRASFELVQKAAMAGIVIVAAIGAPSSLAVSLAQEFNITLIGFLRDHSFNIYTGAHRIN